MSGILPQIKLSKNAPVQYNISVAYSLAPEWTHVSGFEADLDGKTVATESQAPRLVYAIKLASIEEIEFLSAFP